MKTPLQSPAAAAAVGEGPSLVALDSAIFKDVQVLLEASLGRAEMSIANLLDLKAGSIVKLDARLNELVDIRLNDSLVARGEIVAVGDNFGVRILEVAKG